MPAVIVPALSAAHQTALERQNAPLISLADACSGCDHLDGDVDDYPKGFDVDMTSDMLGSIQNYGRQIIISTGKSDWIRDIAEDKTTLAGLVESINSYEPPTPKENGAAAEGKGGLLGKLTKKLKGVELNAGDGKGAPPPGVYPSSAVGGVERDSKLLVLNGSHLSHEEGKQSVLVLPDFKVVEEVPETAEGAADLMNKYLRPDVGRTGSLENTTLKSWPLPYHAVVLFCSHKKRDKKCHIAAPLLIDQFHHHLELHGLEGDERGDDLVDGPPIEEWDPATRDSKLDETLRGVKRNGGRVGLFKVSHIGGHRYAGNVIIYFPNGSCVWYGRVAPRDVAAIVESTVMQGKVIPEFLRGGLGLANKMGEGGLLQW